MRHVLSGAIVCGLVALLTAPACQRRGEREGPRRGEVGDHDHDHDEGHDESNGANLGAGAETRSAARNISGARCEREARCNNIGDGKKFASVEVCEEQIRSEWANDLTAYDCPRGVVDAELDECLTAVKDEDCNSPFDTLSRVSACTAGQICAD